MGKNNYFVTFKITPKFKVQGIQNNWINTENFFTVLLSSRCSFLKKCNFHLYCLKIQKRNVIPVGKTNEKNSTVRPQSCQTTVPCRLQEQPAPRRYDKSWTIPEDRTMRFLGYKKEQLHFYYKNVDEICNPSD